jgi:hypothetical protein
MFSRIKAFLLAILISFDQFAQTVLCGTAYIFGFAKCPSPDETISSLVGRRAIDGKKWAFVAQTMINFIFGLLGSKDHCYRSIEILDQKKYPEA